MSSENKDVQHLMCFHTTYNRQQDVRFTPALIINDPLNKPANMIGCRIGKEGGRGMVAERERNSGCRNNIIRISEGKDMKERGKEGCRSCSRTTKGETKRIREADLRGSDDIIQEC